MSFPSVSSLVSYLFYLAYYTAGYILRTNPYSRVEQYRGYLDTWFRSLRSWAEWFANNAASVVRSWARDWINYLEGWRVWLVNQVNSAWSWINGIGQGITNWYNVVASKVLYLVAHVYNWLVWFWGNPLGAIEAYLGAAWSWLKWFVGNAAGFVYGVLGAAWQWILAFFADKYATLRAIVGPALDWLRWFWSNPLGAIEYYLGWAWNEAKRLLVEFGQRVLAVLGPAWTWLLGLFGLNPNGLVAFIRDAMTYWYNTWSLYRKVISAFLADPATFTLAAIRETFLIWLEQLIADNF